MVFRTVYVQKTNSGTKPRCCDYTFKFNVYGEYEKIFHVVLDTMQFFDNDKIYNGKYTILRDENKISVCIKDFPNRKRRKLEKALKAFAYRLLEMTGTWYLFKI